MNQIEHLMGHGHFWHWINLWYLKYNMRLKQKKKKKNSAKWEKLELSKKVFSFNVSYKFRIYYRADNSFTQWGKEEPCKILYIGPLIGYSYKMLWLLYPVVTFCHIL